VTRDEPLPVGKWEAFEQRHGLLVRVVSALALGALVIAAIVFGGWPHVVLWSVGAIGIFCEWTRVISNAQPPALIVGVGALAVVGLLAGGGLFWAALVVLFIGMVGVFALTGLRLWAAAGLVYAAPVLLGPVVLRDDPQYGIVALIFLCAVVWSTDTLAYFAGRSCGGPKLAPILSPKKTWSGAVGGILGGVAAGIGVAALFNLPNSLAAVCLALLLSVVSQAGDLLESAIKRHFGVKDSSHVIPGHGGLMDRLDGFLVAAGVAAIIGIGRGGTDHPATGLFIW